MTVSDDRGSVPYLVGAAELVRDTFALGSETVMTQSFQGICSTIRSSIKESKPRTEHFRILCRLVARLSYSSPVATIRVAASEIMKEHRHIFHVHDEISPSRFEGVAVVGPLDFSHPNLSSVYPRPTHMDWILSSQGEFLELYRKTTEAVMQSDGPLPRPWRHYIAMMGASAYSCEYLARNQLELFLSSGGDAAWLAEGSVAVPRKLLCLSPISSVMAHRPWTLDSTHIEHVISEGRWSASELVHALIILATFHSLPSLVFGSGIKIEDDLVTSDEACRCPTDSDPLVESEPAWNPHDPLPKCFSLNETTPSLIQRLLLQQATTGTSRSVSYPSQRSVSTGGEEPYISAFEGFGSLNENPNSGVASPVSAVTPVHRAPKISKMGDEEKGELAAIMASHVCWRAPLSRIVSHSGGKADEYRDFMQKSDKILHTMSFSWEDHGMMVMSRQMPDATDCINAEHVHSLEFTTNTIGESHIESTTTVREAIVKYVQRMYGVFHDDYRYESLNKILPVIHKAYLKKLACYPERLTRVDYMRMRQFEGFTAKDLIHYAHLVSQTKRIVELTWTMKALMNYQGGGSS